MDTELFNYHLPSGFIAQTPLTEREKAKMLILDKMTGEIRHDYFYNIINYLKPDDVLVLNDSRVMKCRLFGKKEGTSAQIECFILKKKSNKKALVLLRPARRLSPGIRVFLDQKQDLFFEVDKKLEAGRAVVIFNKNISEVLNSCGVIPLPPYIKNRSFDTDFYQTVYAKNDGSAAAPTAGLHFTKDILDSIKKKKIFIAKTRLDIGLDTFRPITEKSIESHKIHSEEFLVTKANIKKIELARSRKGRVVAVGTTVVRALETLMDRFGSLKEYFGKTELFIYPGYNFKITDTIITNFHLPKSTLMVMISAFAGREKVLAAYEEAIRKKYRFYSLGDCMLIK